MHKSIKQHNCASNTQDDRDLNEERSITLKKITKCLGAKAAEPEKKVWLRLQAKKTAPAPAPAPTLNTGLFLPHSNFFLVHHFIYHFTLRINPKESKLTITNRI